METDRELKNTFKVFFDEGNILNLVFLKDLEGTEASNRQTKLIRSTVLEILDKSDRESPSLLVDLSTLVSSQTNIPSETREIFRELLREIKAERIAFVGGGMVVRIVSKFISIAAGGKELKWFADREEARTWLKKGK